ncbi:hypothetical protein H2248_010021 [Termitomyces sp. 'cryptogamus']|nr:hypothetical protein H2248_010021 [Termitomyces sp. 'cryptogamus']
MMASVRGVITVEALRGHRRLDKTSALQVSRAIAAAYSSSFCPRTRCDSDRPATAPLSRDAVAPADISVLAALWLLGTSLCLASVSRNCSCKQFIVLSKDAERLGTAGDGPLSRDAVAPADMMVLAALWLYGTSYR